MNVHFEYDRHHFPPAPVITIKIDGYSPDTESKVIRALVDSGADGTMIPTMC